MSTKSRKKTFGSSFSLKNADINDKAKQFLEDRKNSNNLIDLLTLFESEERDVRLACIKAFHKLFVHLIKDGEMFLEAGLPLEEENDEHSPETLYKIWLRTRYSDVIEKLLELLTVSETMTKELALCVLMKFVACEGKHPLRKISEKHLCFPAQLFEKVVKALLSDSCDCSALIDRFEEFAEYDDVRYYLMKHTLTTLKSTQKTTDIFLNNVYAVLDVLCMPPGSEERLSTFMATPPDPELSLKINTYKEHKKLFTSFWLLFLRCKLSVGLYKKVLVQLHERVMPHMTSPLLLSDFLTDSYNIGGAISLLALNGLFILVQQYNLEYPEFYKKLYGLFQPTVFHVKYRARFFFLADLFLTSIHLPAYLIAAFSKKLARLSLVAPPTALTVIIPFIYNLLKRHQSCAVLINRPEGPTGLCDDPFVMDEMDPSKCRAMESSLWEIKTLQSHYYHSVATEAKRIDNPLSGLETDISDLLETSIDDLVDKEVSKKLKEVPVTFELPKGLFGNKDDKLREFWSLK